MHNFDVEEQPSASVPNVRVHIQAYRKTVKNENKDVNGNLIVGDVPGIEVGDVVFNFCHQMAVVAVMHEILLQLAGCA
jgi:hypothetical protein